MIEIKIPKEIKGYSEKLFFNLTLRQTICIVLMALINIPVFIFLKDILGADVTGWIVMLNVAPIALIGFFNYNGMPFEEFAKLFLISTFIYPQNRPYKTENIYEEIAKAIQADKEVVENE